MKLAVRLASCVREYICWRSQRLASKSHAAEPSPRRAAHDMQVAGAGDPMRRLKAFATASICGHIAATSLGVMSACMDASRCH